MASLTQVYNRDDKSGSRKRFWRKGSVTLVSSLVKSSEYYAKSTSVNGDHIAPNAYAFKACRTTGVQMRVVSSDSASAVEHEEGYYSSTFSTAASEFTPSSLSWQETAAYNKAVSDLGSKIRGDLDLSINLFQWKQIGQTLGKLRSLTATYMKTVGRIKRGTGSASKEVSSLYLEWTYGVKPLLRDLYDSIDKLMTDAKSGKTVIHYRGRGSSVEQYRMYEEIIAYNTARCSVAIDGYRSVRCQLDISVKPDLSALQKLGNWTSLNPASIAWELMPYSFVIDWFWNLGGFLRGLETVLLYQRSFVSGCRTNTVKTVSNAGGSGTSSTHPYLHFSVSSGDRFYRFYDRTVLTSFPGPERPILKTSLSPWRIVNAIALLLQLQGDTKSHPRVRHFRA